MKTIQQIVMMTEGFVALCLGSSDRIVWVNQTDAAAFSDGEKLYLPSPQGLDGEIELLLGIALREVAKILHGNADVFASIAPSISGYTASIEDARIKQEISETYKGAASVFDAATSVIRRIAVQSLSDDPVNPNMAVQMAIWAGANDAYLGTLNSAKALFDLSAIAVGCVDPVKLELVNAMTQAAPWLKSTHASALCAQRIHAILAEPEPEPEPGQVQAEPMQPDEGQSEGEEDLQPESEPEDDGKQQEQKPEPDSSDQEDPQDVDQSQGKDEQIAQDGAQSEAGVDVEQQGSQLDAHQPTDTQPRNGTLEPAEAEHEKDHEAEESCLGDQQPDSANDSDGSPSLESDQSGSPSNEKAAKDAGVTEFSSDPMSNALAMLKGHKGAAPACQPDQAEQIVEHAQVDNSVLVAVAHAMQQADAIEIICDLALALPSDDFQESPEQMEDAGLMALCAGQLGGDAPASSVMDGANNLGSMPARLVSVLLREFQDKRPKLQLRSQSGRDLSIRHLWRLKALGDTRVFRKKTPSSGIDAAVMLLLDRSGSMHGDIELAASATHAFAQALQRISGVRTAISLFPGDSTATMELLQFRQSAVHAASKLRAVTAEGGTPTDEAIMEILPLLLQTTVQKRFIVLITDGGPDNVEATRKAVAHANSMGVDVIGIGIGKQTHIQGLLSRSVSITEVGELPTALEALFKDELSTSLVA